MNKKIILIAIPIIVMVVILAILITPKPCGHENYAWGSTKSDCDCFGYKIDTSCTSSDGGPCPDAGSKTSCIGIIKEKKCYEFQGRSEQGGFDWKQISCNN